MYNKYFNEVKVFEIVSPNCCENWVQFCYVTKYQRIEIHFKGGFITINLFTHKRCTDFLVAAYLNDSFSDESLSNDILSNDSLSNDRLSNDRLSNDRLSNDRLSNNVLSNDSLYFSVSGISRRGFLVTAYLMTA